MAKDELHINAGTALHSLYPAEDIRYWNQADLFNEIDAKDTRLTFIGHAGTTHFGSHDFFQGYTPEEFVHELIRKGIPSHIAKMDIISCSGGLRKMGEPITYVMSVAGAMLVNDDFMSPIMEVQTLPSPPDAKNISSMYTFVTPVQKTFSINGVDRPVPKGAVICCGFRAKSPDEKKGEILEISLDEEKFNKKMDAIGQLENVKVEKVKSGIDQIKKLASAEKFLIELQKTMEVEGVKTRVQDLINEAHKKETSKAASSPLSGDLFESKEFLEMEQKPIDEEIFKLMQREVDLIEAYQTRIDGCAQEEKKAIGGIQNEIIRIDGEIFALKKERNEIVFSHTFYVWEDVRKELDFPVGEFRPSDFRSSVDKRKHLPVAASIQSPAAGVGRVEIKGVASVSPRDVITLTASGSSQSEIPSPLSSGLDLSKNECKNLDDSREVRSPPFNHL